MTTIVKVQRPLFPPGADWLLYDKKREHETLVPPEAIPQHVKAAMGDDVKAYFVGAWSSVVGWGLTRRVPDKRW